MRKGIFIPAAVARVVVGTVSAVLLALLVSSTPDAVRYFKMKTM